VLIWLISTVVGDEPASNKVKMPDVTGLSLEEAQNELRSQGFAPLIKYVVCEQQPSGAPGECGPDNVNKVIRTEPTPGTEVNKTDKIFLVVGQEPAKIAVPDVIGKTPDEAKAILEQAGLTMDPNVAEEETEDESQIGKVIASDPAGTTQVKKGSAVKITIGKGPDNTAVPNLVGQDFETAKANLEGLGFTVKREERDSDKPANQVIDQNPRSGEHPPETEITLVVSNGSEQDDDKITMPNLEGMRVGEARQTLRGLGWEGSFNEVEQDVQDPGEIGKIQQQEVPPGTKIEKNQDIGIAVGAVGIGGR
jgi:serine/threonine-protein kinase